MKDSCLVVVSFLLKSAICSAKKEKTDSSSAFGCKYVPRSKEEQPNEQNQVVFQCSTSVQKQES